MYMLKQYKPISVFKNALLKLKKSFEKHRKHLLECLAQKEKLLETDVEWLNNEGNLINEEHVLETLDAASDFEQGVKQLSDDERAAFEQLKRVADNDVGKKRKRRSKCLCHLSNVKAKSFITGTDSAKLLSNSANASGHVKGHAKPRPAVFTKKENATLVQRIEILDWFHANGKHQSKTARHFDTIYPNLKFKQPIISE